MEAISKKRRNRQKYYTFFFACSASFVGLLFYVVCSRVIPFPDNWISSDISKSGIGGRNKLFFFGINIHLQVNLYLGVFFALLGSGKMDETKIQRLKY